MDDLIIGFAQAHPRVAGAGAGLFLLALVVGTFAGWVDAAAVEAQSPRLGALVRLVARLGVVVRGAAPLFVQLVTGQIPSPPVPHLDTPDGPPTPRDPSVTRPGGPS